jgi:hypothetical protein
VGISESAAETGTRIRSHTVRIGLQRQSRLFVLFSLGLAAAWFSRRMAGVGDTDEGAEGKAADRTIDIPFRERSSHQCAVPCCDSARLSN